MSKKHSNAPGDEVQENSAARLSRMGSNDSPSTTRESNAEETNDGKKQKDKKQGRGPSKLKLNNGKAKAKELERNDHGQPIGDNSLKYSSFLDCMVKEFVPYTVERWDDIEDDVKDKMWECLKDTYVVHDWEKKKILQKLDKLWRGKKFTLQRLIRQANEGTHASRGLALIKPEYMDKKEWDLFVKKTLSPAFQEKSAKFRAMRAKQLYDHTTSRRGFARLNDKLKKDRPGEEITRVQVWIEGHTKSNGQPSSQAVADKVKALEACSVEKQRTNDINNDAIKEVFGKEARGRVRGMGFGVTPSSVGAQVQQNSRVSQLENMVHTLFQKVQEMSGFYEAKKQHNPQEQAASGGIGSAIKDEVASGGDASGTKRAGGSNANDTNPFAFTPQSNHQNVSSKEIPIEGTKCKLMHWEVDGVVAEGRIAWTDPTAKGHHAVLGRSCWKIWVERVLVEKIDLPRPTEEMACLEDAIGSTVARLSKFIVCD